MRDEIQKVNDGNEDAIVIDGGCDPHDVGECHG